VIQEILMGEMAAGLITKAEQVCHEDCSMAPPSVTDALVAKMRSIIEDNEEEGGATGTEGGGAIYVDCQLKVILLFIFLPYGLDCLSTQGVKLCKLVFYRQFSLAKAFFLSHFQL